MSRPKPLEPVGEAVFVFILGSLGALGACSRYLADRYVMSKVSTDFPLGTLFVNLSGAITLGLFTGAHKAGLVPSEIDTLIGVGFIGAFTTFSTFSYESVALALERSYYFALLNVGISVFAGIISLSAGYAIGVNL